MKYEGVVGKAIKINYVDTAASYTTVPLKLKTKRWYIARAFRMTHIIYLPR